jgi:hypothetical protein
VRFGRQITIINLLSPFSEQNERGEAKKQRHGPKKFAIVLISKRQVITPDLKVH